jgi:hypothetical protein
MNGLWAGMFRNQAGQVQGSVRLRIMGGGDTAYGYLVLGDTVPRVSCSGEELMTVDGRPVLHFHLMRVTSSGIAGWVEPYRDLQLGCRIDTWFEATRIGDSLAGMYYARPTDGSPLLLGRWWAVRERR